MLQKKPDVHPWQTLGEALRATTLGWELALPIFGGVLAGYYLDRRLETGHVFTMGLLMLGVSISAYNLWRFIRRLDAWRKQDAAESKDEEREEG